MNYNLTLLYVYSVAFIIMSLLSMVLNYHYIDDNFFLNFVMLYIANIFYYVSYLLFYANVIYCVGYIMNSLI